MIVALRTREDFFFLQLPSLLKHRLNVWAVGPWGEELLYVWCFLGPQQNEAESCQEVTHLTDMCTLRFLKHVFEAPLSKKRPAACNMGGLALSREDQHSRCVLTLGSLH